MSWVGVTVTIKLMAEWFIRERNKHNIELTRSKHTNSSSKSKQCENNSNLIETNRKKSQQHQHQFADNIMCTECENVK